MARIICESQSVGLYVAVVVQSPLFGRMQLIYHLEDHKHRHPGKDIDSLPNYSNNLLLFAPLSIPSVHHHYYRFYVAAGEGLTMYQYFRGSCNT